MEGYVNITVSGRASAVGEKDTKKHIRAFVATISFVQICPLRQWGIRSSDPYLDKNCWACVLAQRLKVRQAKDPRLLNFSQEF